MAVGLLVVILLGVVTILSARPAAAHASLIASDPPEDAALDDAPTQVTLTFSEQVEHQFARVEVTASDGARVESGEATVDGAQVSMPLASLTRVGTYRVSYHVVSADSHPIEGEYTFEVTHAAAAASPPPQMSSAASEPVANAPSPAASELDAAPTAAEAARESRPNWLLTAAAAVIALACAYLLLRRRGRSSD